MPDTREKLVELIGTTEYGNGSLIGNNFQTGFIERIADHLIANGVTFATDNNVTSKWIPVTERLPEPFVSVLACIPSEAPLPTVHESYVADHDKWVCILTAERYKDGEVTHWMPLPEPPKGE